VKKNRNKKTISVKIHSSILRQSVRRAILAHSPSWEIVANDFEALLRHYDALKSYLHRMLKCYPTEVETLELTLLISDFLLDRAIYDGIGLEIYRNRQVLCLTHVLDIHERSVATGINEIEDCFALGLVPDEIDENYLEALNTKYTDLALSGDYAGLYNMCEPIVRSGEIELQYNPCLLLDLLNQGRLDIYQYVLDLVSRTRDTTVTLPGELPDVTFHPLYVAIKLGHVEKVQILLSEGATFEGRVYDIDNEVRLHQILTPLSAAVEWAQPDIVRLLLSMGPDYHSGLENAIALALSCNYDEIIRIFLDSGALLSAGFPEEYRQDELDGLTLDPSLLSLDPSPDQQGQDIVPAIPIEAPPDFKNLVAAPQQYLYREPVENEAGVPRSQPIDIPMPDHGEDTKKRAQRKSLVPSTSRGHNFHHSQPQSSRRKRGQRERQRLGREIVTSLNSHCSRIREICGRADCPGPMRQFGSQFTSVSKVWDGGMSGYRSIMANEVPRTLVEIINCLLVASALCCSVFHDDEELYLQ
jgi:hypothetical protein